MSNDPDYKPYETNFLLKIKTIEKPLDSKQKKKKRKKMWRKSLEQFSTALFLTKSKMIKNDFR